MDFQKNTFQEITSGTVKCSHCKVVTRHFWWRLSNDSFGTPETDPDFDVGKDSPYLAKCSECKQHSLWNKQQLLYPDPIDSDIQQLPPEAGKQAIQDHIEAVSIATKSPRAASALLRSAIENLLKNVSKENSVEKNLQVLIEENKGRIGRKNIDFMEKIRVFGQDAIPSKQIDNQDQDSVEGLLFLLECVRERMITEPKMAKKFSAIPESDIPQENSTSFEVCDNSPREELQ